MIPTPVPVGPLLLRQLTAARLLGVSPRKLREWTRHGLVPTYTDPESGRVLYPRAALERWAAEMKAETNP